MGISEGIPGRVPESIMDISRYLLSGEITRKNLKLFLEESEKKFESETIRDSDLTNLSESLRVSPKALEICTKILCEQKKRKM